LSTVVLYLGKFKIEPGFHLNPIIAQNEMSWHGIYTGNAKKNPLEDGMTETVKSL